jgi:hypothetical protein
VGVLRGRRVDAYQPLSISFNLVVFHLLVKGLYEQTRVLEFVLFILVKVLSGAHRHNVDELI